MKNLFSTIFFAFLGILLFSSCITNKDKLYLQGDQRNKASKVVPFKSYKLNTDDEIIFYLMTSSRETQALYNNSQQSLGGHSSGYDRNNMPFRIDGDGYVDLPTVGKLKIAGLTLRDAETLITEHFKTIVVDAEVRVALSDNYFYVEGDGGKGRFPVYKEDLTIFQALALAGDISSTGDKAHIKLIRKGADGIDRMTVLDLRKESVIGTEQYYIQPNDVIYIPTNANSFFRIESVSGFVSMVVAPLSLVVAALTYFKK
jgi:polysaccharide export outer membrane protein